MSYLNDEVRHKLKELVARHGRALGENEAKCRGLLQDHCPNSDTEIYLLVSAIQVQVPKRIMEGVGSLKISLEESIKRLARKRGMEEQLARWAVESWAAALGLIDSNRVTAPTGPAGTTPPQSTPSASPSPGVPAPVVPSPPARPAVPVVASAASAISPSTPPFRPAPPPPSPKPVVSAAPVPVPPSLATRTPPHPPTPAPQQAVVAPQPAPGGKTTNTPVPQPKPRPARSILKYVLGSAFLLFSMAGVACLYWANTPKPIPPKPTTTQAATTFVAPTTDTTVRFPQRPADPRIAGLQRAVEEKLGPAEQYATELRKLSDSYAKLQKDDETLKELLHTHPTTIPWGEAGTPYSRVSAINVKERMEGDLQSYLNAKAKLTDELETAEANVAALRRVSDKLRAGRPPDEADFLDVKHVPKLDSRRPDEVRAFFLTTYGLTKPKRDYFETETPDGTSP